MNFGKVLASLFGVFGSWALVAGAYSLGKYLSKGAAASSWLDKLKVYLLTTVLVAVVSLLMWEGYGTYSEGGHYEGPRGDNESGDIVVDFVPTNEERNEYGARVLIILLIPLLYGVHKGHKAAGVPHRTSAAVFKWFKKNKKALLSNDYSPELSYGRADEIVQSYADVLAKGGRGFIANASRLPYQKETIRAAIDRHIEDLISRPARDRRFTELMAENRIDDAVRVASGSGTDHELEDTSEEPKPELERIIGTLGASKWHLFDFCDIDPEDEEAVAVLNSCPEHSAPESADETERSEFLFWLTKILSKYRGRATAESKRLEADTTVEVKRTKTWEVEIAEVKRRMAEMNK